MAEANMQEGYGVTLHHASTEVVGVIDVTPAVSAIDNIETSHMASTDRFKTFKPGWADAGEMSAKLHFDKAVVGALYTLKAARTPEVWKVTWADGTKFECSGFLREIGNPTDRVGMVTVDIKIKLSGVPTFTPFAAP